jgi:hypothetical protein
MTKTSRSRTRRFKHPFRFKVEGIDGKQSTLVSWAVAKNATKPIDLVLTAEHVRKSIRLKGIGNTQTCSMAVCAMDHRDLFPHDVDGFVDWTYRRAVIVTAVGNKTGMPIRCVVYEHNSKIAHLNDTKNGQEALLKMIEDEGPITVHLLPAKERPTSAQAAKARNERLAKKKQQSAPMNRTFGQGAKRRFAVASLGGAFASPPPAEAK